MTTLTLGWVTLPETLEVLKKNQAAQPHDIIMVSEPRLQGREVKEGNIGEETFFVLPLDSLFSSNFFSNFRE